MNKQQTLKQVVKFLDEIQWLFEINNFDRNVILADPDGDKEACISYDQTYKLVTIKLYPHFFEWTPANQRKALLHELCHCLTLPSKLIALDLTDGILVTKKQIHDENEQLTSRVENILNALLLGRYKYASQAYANYIKKPKDDKKGTRANRNNTKKA